MWTVLAICCMRHVDLNWRLISLWKISSWSMKFMIIFLFHLSLFGDLFLDSLIYSIHTFIGYMFFSSSLLKPLLISIKLFKQGYILTSEIDGTIQMKSYLTGNPEIRLALNDDLTIGRGGRSVFGIFLWFLPADIWYNNSKNWLFHYDCDALKLFTCINM